MPRKQLFKKLQKLCIISIPINKNHVKICITVGVRCDRLEKFHKFLLSLVHKQMINSMISLLSPAHFSNSQYVLLYIYIFFYDIRKYFYSPAKIFEHPIKVNKSTGKIKRFAQQESLTLN